MATRAVLARQGAAAAAHRLLPAELDAIVRAMQAGRDTARLISLLPIIAAACQSRTPASNRPIFGGQGAVVGNAGEMPLAPEREGEAKPKVGPCAAPSPSADGALVDDFEDGDAKVFKAFQREGYWWAASDNSDGSTLYPAAGKFAPDRRPTGEAGKYDALAAHFKAQGQKDWGAIWGATLHWASKGIRCPLNASSFAGLKLRAKGPATIRVAFGLPETLPPDGGGTCTTSCYDTHGEVLRFSDRWDEYVVRWDRLQQGGWGTEARFDPGRIISISFAARPDALPVDFWVDDIEFISPRDLATTSRMTTAPAASAGSGTPAR